MKWAVLLSRIFLVFWLGICVVDGWGYILFGYHLTGEPTGLPFLEALIGSMWFWVSFKIVQTLGVLSLLLNYKTAFGLFLLLPSLVVICLFYFFVLTPFIPVAILIIISTLVLLKYHQDKYMQLLKD